MDCAGDGERGCSVRQGASKHALRDRANDLYETPACAVHALLRHEKLPHTIWEPCAGRGALSRELRAYGHYVVTEDLVGYSGADAEIVFGRDFLMERIPRCRTIVTNPPFKLADQFIRHGLGLGCDVIVLLRLMALEGSSRSDIIDGHLTRVWAGIERLPGMHREGWEGNKLSNSSAPFAWFVFSAKKKPLGTPIELRRISWRT
jgi:hypothetical protein